MENQTRPGPVTGLPNRYEDVLNRRVAEMREAQVNAAGQAPGGPGGALKQWAMRGALAAAGGAALMIMAGAGKSSARSQSTSLITSSNLVSRGSLGVNNDVESLLPPAPAQPKGEASRSAATGALVDEHSHARDEISLPTEPTRPVAKPTGEKRKAGRCLECEARAAAAGRGGPATENQTSGEDQGIVIFSDDDQAGDGLVIVPGQAESSRATLNVGSRFQAELVFGVRTDAAPVPVTARIAQDVTSATGVALRAGSVLVGRAIAIEENDRVQMAFGAVVQDGVTYPIQAIAIGADGQLGVKGKLIRKASGKKKWVGRTLGAVGSAVSFGILGASGGGAVDAAAAELLQRGGTDLTGLERQWTLQRSDKVIETPASTAITLYLEGDFKPGR